MIKKYKKENYENLHGQELIDTLMRDNTFGTVATKEQNRETIRLIDEKNRRLARSEARRTRIMDALRPILFTTIAILFRVINFAFRIISGIASVVMFYGFYCACKAFTLWRDAEVFANYVQTAIMLIVFPFTASAITVLAGKAWRYFENNK